MRLIEILTFTEEYLKKYSFSKARQESRAVVSYVLNIDAINLYANFNRELNENERDEIKKILKIMTNQNKSFKELELKNRNFKEENLKLLEQTIDYLKKK